MSTENVKKVGTLTFHIAHNYGAVLQAYALPKAVQMLGFECEVIHYCFPYIYGWGHMERWNELNDTYGVFVGTLRYMKRRLSGYYNPRHKRSKFEKFIYEVLPLSEKPYYTVSELQNMNYDVILFGSDQIWNSKLTGGIAKEFAGGFPCMKKTRKIAYAASCGRSSFLEEEKKNYYPLLKDFYALGIRENGLCQSLCRDGFDVVPVLDPTLLLNKEQWDRMIKPLKYEIKIPEKEYLLVYIFDEDDSIYEFIDRVAVKYGLEVCFVAYKMKEKMKKYKIFLECGPEDFVRLIAGASRIVTTSFHGTVFSILYEKDFYCVPHPTLHERTDSLLDVLGLSDRNCSSTTDIDAMHDILWDRVRESLGVLREDSLKFLREAIG